MAGNRTRRPLRICHLAYTFYENDNRVIRYAEALAERGCEVDVVALRRPGQRRVDVSGNVRVFRIQRRAINEKNALAYLLKILWFFFKSGGLLTLRHLRKQYDVVHVHNVPDFLIFAAAVPRLMGARLVLDIHDILPELYAGKFGAAEDSAVFRALLRVERSSCAFADHVIVANHLWHKKLVERALAAEKCTPILNFPDLRLFMPVSAGGRRSDGKFLILYPGTLNHHQGLDVAIKAFALVKDRMPNAELHIYGEGPARPSLAALIEERALGDRVCLRDRLTLAQIAPVMALADVGVVPKRADGFGNEAFSTKILEFMACGVPVVVSRTQVDSHYFNDTIVRFFTSGDENHLAKTLLDVYEDRFGHGAWIKAARDFAVQHSWQERVVDYLDIIDSLVGVVSRTAAASN